MEIIKTKAAWIETDKILRVLMVTKNGNCQTKLIWDIDLKKDVNNEWSDPIIQKGLK